MYMISIKNNCFLKAPLFESAHVRFYILYFPLIAEFQKFLLVTQICLGVLYCISILLRNRISESWRAFSPIAKYFTAYNFAS